MQNKISQRIFCQLIGIMFFMCTSIAHAESNWESLGFAPDGNEVFVDASSIEYIDENTRSFRGKTNSIQPVEGVVSVTVDIVLQCNTKVAEIHSLSFFNNLEGVGQPVNKVDYEIPEFIPFDESEADLNTLRRVCFPESNVKNKISSPSL